MLSVYCYQHEKASKNNKAFLPDIIFIISRNRYCHNRRSANTSKEPRTAY
ncbi:MAG: hypothetical protein JWR38_1067 [Mucilaginibacter sp.]|nr:hypothetical protein [Mucilaginibacter sp.]